MIAVLALAVLVPSVAVAAGSFTDDDGNTHEANIEWMADRGITVGCRSGEFCPDKPVTRAQMATFMRRLVDYLGDSGTGTVDNADMTDGYDASDLVRLGWCYNDDAPDGDEMAAGEYTCEFPITAPVAGHIVVNGSAELWADTGSDFVSCDLRLDDVQMSGSDRDIVVDSADGSRESNCATNTGALISAGSHTVAFRLYGVGINVGVVGVGANAVFSPFAG
jgi:hypothetical protein